MSTQRAPWKPSYRLSGWGFRLSFVCSWVAAFMILSAGLFGNPAMQAGATSMAPIYLPAMVLIILGVLGIHRMTGAADLRAILAQNGQPRDDPVAETAAEAGSKEGDQ